MNENTQPGMNVQPNPQPVQPNPQPVQPNPQPVQPTPAVEPTPVMPQPQVAPTVEPAPVAPQVAPIIEPTPVQSVDPMSAVSNLNKEEAMEEALSHTTQYSPFQVEQQVVNEAPKKTDNKKAYMFIGIIASIMAIFILLLPYISKMFNI